MRRRSMRRFWDDRAAENPYFFVDNRLQYGDPDLTRFWAGGPESLEQAIRRLEIPIAPTDEVIEIGCGVGRITRALAARCASVRAVDVSERMVARARELNAHLQNVTWTVGDGHSLAEFEAESADGCYSDVVFQHIPDPEITLGYVAEMARVLRPGGWAAFQVSNDPMIHRSRSLAERARGTVRALVGRGPHGQAHPAWLGSAIDLDELRARAENAGAMVERVEGEGTQFCYGLLRKRAA